MNIIGNLLSCGDPDDTVAKDLGDRQACPFSPGVSGFGGPPRGMSGDGHDSDSVAA
jgi:hypothetical protein